MNRYSVVVPMYNSATTIDKSLDSVLCQTRYDLIDEIIIVDDGSVDDSLKIVYEYIEKYECEKIKIVKKENGGAASARNIGIRNAKNSWIALLDADDVWYEKKIEIQDSILNGHPEIEALGSNREGEIVHHGIPVEKGLYRLTPVQYCVKNWPCTPSLIFNRNVFGEDCCFDERLSHAEEGIFFLELSAKSGLYYTTEVLVSCGGGKPAFGHSGLSGNIKKMHDGIVKVMRLAYNRGYLTNMEYALVNVLEYLKYYRRKLIVFYRNKKVRK